MSEIAPSLAWLRSQVDEAAAALNARVAALYPIGSLVTVQHPGSPMRGTVVRHADSHYHAGELLVRGKGGGQQWVKVERILDTEAKAA